MAAYNVYYATKSSSRLSRKSFKYTTFVPFDATHRIDTRTLLNIE